MSFPTAGVRFGNQLGALVERPNSPKVEFMADGVVMITRRWSIDSLNDIVLAPHPKDYDPLGYNAQCISTVVTNGPQEQSEVVSTFQGYVTLPPSIYEFANSRMDRPIQMHPDFNDVTVFPCASKLYQPIIQGVTYTEPTDANPIGQNAMFVRFKDIGTNSSDANAKFRGIEAYIVGSAQFRKTSYSLVPDFDQTDVGKLSAPSAGPYSATLPDPYNSAHKWLKIEKTCVNMLKGASTLWTITEVWQYNDLGWLTEIYS